ncbi:MAG: hypothetical protein AAB358_01150, partial [Patescibacteria group bacterium]
GAAIIGYSGGLQATGDYAVAMGENAIASGRASLAIGGVKGVAQQAIASGLYSVAIGKQAIASGESSFAMGGGGLATTEASGDNSVAFGLTKSFGDGTFAAGYGGYPAIGMTRAGGSGSIALGYSAVAVYSVSPDSSYTNVAIGSAVQATGQGGYAIGQGVTASGNGSFAFGSSIVPVGGLNSDAIAKGHNSMIIGFRNIAGKEGQNSWDIAMGTETTADGGLSTTLGYRTHASGALSTALGEETTASGGRSFSTGSETKASGYYSTVFGQFTEAKASHSVVLGRYNVIAGDSWSWLDNDPLFVIGNGYNIGATIYPSNALTVLKNGNVGIKETNPDVKLAVGDGTDSVGNIVSVNGVDTAYTGYRLQTADAEKWFMGMDNTVSNNDLIIRRNGVTSDLIVKNDTGNVGIGTANPIMKFSSVYNGYSAEFYSGDTNLNGILIYTPLGAAQQIISDYNGTATQKPLILRTWDNQNQLVLNSNGNVGIGTVAPTQLLQVQGSTNPGIQLSSAAGIGYLGISTSNGGWSNISTPNDFVIRANTEDLILTARNASGAIRFSTGATDTEKMTILSGGNVGIGTTNPTVKLEVNGIFKLTPRPAQPYGCDATHKGEMYFNSMANDFYGCDGGGWRKLDQF